MSALEHLYETVKTFVFPLLSFANIYVDEEDGVLRPCNKSREYSYKDEGRELMIVKNRGAYVKVKDHKDEYEMFNPLSVPRHCVFLANMVMAAANEKDIDNQPKGMVYDDDLDEYIVNDESMVESEIEGPIKMFQAKGDSKIDNKIFFSRTDKSGNPKGKILAEYDNPDIIYSTIGAMYNLIANYQKTLVQGYPTADSIIVGIQMGMYKFQKERDKEKKNDAVLNNTPITDEDSEEIYDDIMDVDTNIDFYINPFLSNYGSVDDKMYFPWDKTTTYDPSNNECKVFKNLLMPTFKNIEEPEKEAMSNMISDMQQFDQFGDIEFIN